MIRTAHWQSHLTLFAWLWSMAFAIALVATAAHAAAPAKLDANTAGAMDCAKLAAEDFSKVADAPATISSAKIVPAAGGTNEYCAVTGYVQPQVQFEVRLPTKTWNGRYLQGGCGGFCGMITINACNDALAKDFATAAEDMGHVAARDELWGADPLMRADYGSRSTHVLALAAKAVIERFYGSQPGHSYFRGCSTGGREGLSEAIKYPEDFDGIVAGDPAFPGRQGAIANNWIAHFTRKDDGSAVFPDAKLDMLHAAVVKACDAADGVADGIIGDPRDCAFKVAKLACPQGQDRPDCLTAQQVAAAEKMYDGPRDSKGQRLYPGGTPLGSEISWKRDADSNFAQQYLRYLGFPQVMPATYSFRAFNFDTDVAKTEEMAKLYDPIAPHQDPDMSAFHKRGGKLIVYHGWADMSVSPYTTLDTYAKVAKHEGGLAAVQEWYRVFMIPGMQHCRGGGVPDRFDMLAAMVAWVEHKQTPDRVVAAQEEGGKTLRTRPLFPYPTMARYSGKGDVNDEKSWQPAKPKAHADDVTWIWSAQ